jgi:NAD(P)-dependent dehydrogenase (short-subunit alcohol dehydrogenase family)
MTNPLIIVLGAGPGIGAAVARRFGRAGYDPALISRSPDALTELGEQLQAEGLTTGWTAVDLTDRPRLSAAIERFGSHAGSIQHLHFNPSVTRMADPLSLSAEDLLADVHVGAASLLTAVQAARPFMSVGARITATGSMAADHPWAAAASLGVQKAGLRSLVSALDATLKPEGIRAVTVTVAGTVQAGTPFDPTNIAEAIFAAAHTDDEFWADEVRFTGRD